MTDATRTHDPAATLTQETVADLGGRPPSPPGYVLAEEVGRGGMGVVYRARDLQLDREVAVKVLADRFNAGSVAAARFVDEARVTGRLQHPGVPAVYQVGTLPDGRPFLAMKLIRGRTLAERLAAGDTVDPLGVFEAVAQAVGSAHAQGVLHRDLKPANIMVGPFGEVQVMDWGLAKRSRKWGGGRGTGEEDQNTSGLGSGLPPPSPVPPPHSPGLTRAGAVLGTPAYMPPEQAAGDLDRVDRRSDVFGLGAVLCELLTGRPPYAGDAEGVWQRASRGNLGDALVRLDGCGADPGAVDLCRRCLAADPADRPADAAVVAGEVAALRAAAEERARRAERDRHAAEVRAAEGRKRRRVLLWAGGGLAAVLVLGLAGTTVGLVQADAARHAARADQRLAELKAQESAAAQQSEFAQRRVAEAAQVAAVTKAAEAEAAMRFLEDRVLAAARPRGRDGGLGHDVTLRAAIAAAVPTLAAGFADQPLVEARLRLALGTTFYYLGDPQTAADQQRRAADLYAARLGPDHPDTLRALNNLSLSLDDLGRRDEALALREADVAAARRTLPADDPGLFKSLNNLANSYSAAGRHADALRLHDEALAGRRRVLGADHPDALGSLHNRAAALAAAGRPADALRDAEAALAGFRRTLGPDHPDTLKALTNLAVSYTQAGRPVDALRLREEALAAQRRVLGPDHPDTRTLTVRVVRDLTAAGRAVDAVPLAVELADRWEAAGHADLEGVYTTACYRAVAAGALAAAGRPAEATAAGDRAMAWLGKAVAAGLPDRSILLGDPDLTPLHGRPDFRKLVATLPEPAPPPRPADKRIP